MLAMAGSLFLGGCALTEEAIPVVYTAPASYPAVPGAEAVTVNVSSADVRLTNRDRVSSKKNGFGVEMARITSENDVVAEIGNAVQAELAALGYKVGHGGIDVSVETQTVYADFKPGLWSADAVAEVAFNLTAREPDGAIIYSRIYKAAGTNRDIMLMTGANARPALEAALRDAVQLVVRDAGLHKALVKAGSRPSLARAPTS